MGVTIVRLVRASLTASCRLCDDCDDGRCRLWGGTPRAAQAISTAWCRVFSIGRAEPTEEAAWVKPGLRQHRGLAFEERLTIHIANLLKQFRAY